MASETLAYAHMCWVFACIYSIIFVLLIVSWRSIEKYSKLSAQKQVYHILLIISVFLKIPSLIAEPFIPNNSKIEAAIVLFLLSVSGFFFVFTFFLFLLLWVSIYRHAKRDNPQIPLKPFQPEWNHTPIAIVIGIIMCTIITELVFGLLGVMSEVRLVTFYVFAFMNCGVAFGFLYYGTCLLLLVRDIFASSSRKGKISKKLIFVTALCTICFVVRAVILVTQTIVCENEVRCSPSIYLEIFFFVIGEIVPLLSMMAMTKMHSDLKRQVVDKNSKLLTSDHYDSDSLSK